MKKSKIEILIALLLVLCVGIGSYIWIFEICNAIVLIVYEIFLLFFSLLVPIIVKKGNCTFALGVITEIVLMFCLYKNSFIVLFLYSLLTHNFHVK